MFYIYNHFVILMHFSTIYNKNNNKSTGINTFGNLLTQNLQVYLSLVYKLQLNFSTKINGINLQSTFVVAPAPHLTSKPQHSP